ncbi:hypothetical protein CYMTET_56428 [Cymbomonas tetramitiformis]|uniref:Uncharacterized protein n=1 Tax=Cymbomonas tetramitiformis TaxID=36881 RepID=A0AAE0EMK5_9CHLO|nr:hypothetical protein CYMTET_56428 [Cymbomonas tetramitiformis]
MEASAARSDWLSVPEGECGRMRAPPECRRGEEQKEREREMGSVCCSERVPLARQQAMTSEKSRSPGTGQRGPGSGSPEAEYTDQPGAQMSTSRNSIEHSSCLTIQHE